MAIVSLVAIFQPARHPTALSLCKEVFERLRLLSPRRWIANAVSVHGDVVDRLTVAALIIPDRNLQQSLERIKRSRDRRHLGIDLPPLSHLARHDLDDEHGDLLALAVLVPLLPTKVQAHIVANTDAVGFVDGFEQRAHFAADGSADLLLEVAVYGEELEVGGLGEVYGYHGVVDVAIWRGVVGLTHFLL